MTEKEIEGISKICEHIEGVGGRLIQASNLLMRRAIVHDASKFSPDELTEYLKAAEEKRDIEFGSDEYYEHMEKYKHIADKHYSLNRHHPEHHENGINDMSLIDLLEMLCDWCTAAKDIDQSIEINAKDYGISPQLRQILKNTACVLEGDEEV